MAVTISGSDGISGDLPTIKVGNGSESAPAVTGQDTDTGLFFGTNEIKVSTSGTETIVVNPTGLGIGTSSPAGRLHVSSAGTTRCFIEGSDGRNEIRSNNGNLSFFANQDANASGLNTTVFYRNGANESMRIDSDGRVEINSGYLELNGNQVGGIQVTIADDAFATITPPRQGQAWIFVQTNSGATFPKNSPSGFALIDFGSSPAIRTETVNAEFETNSGGPPTGTTGSDNHLTLFYGGTAGEIYLENRLGSSVAVQLTFL